MLLSKQHCFCPLLKCVSLLSEVVTSARTPPWLHVCIVGTGSAEASETLAGDNRHLRAVVFLPFLFRGLTESLNSVRLVCVHHWPWFSFESASCWSTALCSSSLWTFTWSSSIRDAPHPNLILWDLAATSEAMCPQALSLKMVHILGIFWLPMKPAKIPSISTEAEGPQLAGLINHGLDSVPGPKASMWCPLVRYRPGLIPCFQFPISLPQSGDLGVWTSQADWSPGCPPAPCGMPLCRPCISSFYPSLKFCSFLFFSQ